MDELGALAEALVANGVGPRICGLLLLGGLVAGALWVGRGSDLQCRLVHLQVEGYRALAVGKTPPAMGLCLADAAVEARGPVLRELQHDCVIPTV